MSPIDPGRGLSTGLPALDIVLKGILPGDNLVWQISRIEDYQAFVTPKCEHARRTGRKVVYFRFAKHKPLVDSNKGIEIHQLDPHEGFEKFIDGIHAAIEKGGSNSFYLFDCLSDLAADWFSDRMLGNIFMLTCPYLFDIQAVAYFALLRNNHSFHATIPIADTAQILIDVYHHNGKHYIHPLKVQQRFSPSIHLLHVWENDEFLPVTESTTIAEILTASPWSRLESSSYRLGPWSSTFLQAEEVLHALERGEYDPRKASELTHQLMRMLISRDERALAIAARYLDLSDIVNIRMRMIGTGLIGGKAVGLLLSHAIMKKAGPRWEHVIEPNDAFFIGSDVFYTFLVQNGVWWVRQKQRNPETFLEGAEDARRRILTGAFPEYINRQFADMLDYFGQSPIIVRSSSVLEDSFGASLAGKGKSVFCANQGPRHERLEDFTSAIKTIYASSMSREALIYRARRGILQREEQMAILVQRVSGATSGSYFFPHVAGVGFSFNPYKWNENIDPQAGVLRLVFGLGTRAVDRSDDDYTRIVALNAPERRPETSFDEVREFAQRKVDLLDLAANRRVSVHFIDVARQSGQLPLDLFCSKDSELERLAAERGSKDVFSWVLTFERLLTKTAFVDDMRSVLKTLEQAYHYPVDIEFTANFTPLGDYRIGLLQCRPFEIKEEGIVTDLPEKLRDADVLFRCEGVVIGRSRMTPIDRIVYVLPSEYSRLTDADKVNVARIIGKLTHLTEPGIPKSLMLLGPGRWGTTTPSLGVPIASSDINSVAVLVELVAMDENTIPDVSLGTHFFNELVELDILYLALYPGKESTVLREEVFRNAPNRLPFLLPDAAKWANVIHVVDSGDFEDGTTAFINANALKQKAVCYLERSSTAGKHSS